MANEDRSILLNLNLNLDTRSSSRNVDEKKLAIDITENDDFNNQSFKLAANNAEGSNPKSEKLIYDVETFFYIYSPYTVSVVLNKADNSTITLQVSNVCIICDAFTSINVVNRDTSNPAEIKLIYS